MPAIIVLGDKTDHGGQVIEASGFTDTHGKKMARVGDKVHCPKKGHGITEIVTGDISFVIDGKAVAYHGCKTSCGAMLISSQAVSTVEFGSGRSGGAASGSGTNVSLPAAGRASAKEAAYDLHFLVKDDKTGRPLPGIAYRITLESGEQATGITDENGLTKTIGSDSPVIAKLEAPYYGDSTSGTHTHDEYGTCSC